MCPVGEQEASILAAAAGILRVESHCSDPEYGQRPQAGWVGRS